MARCQNCGCTIKDGICQCVEVLEERIIDLETERDQLRADLSEQRGRTREAVEVGYQLYDLPATAKEAGAGNVLAENLRVILVKTSTNPDKNGGEQP